MRAVLILNPTAGGGKPAKIEEKVDRTFRRYGVQCDTVLTRKSGDASDLARKAAAERYDVVIAGGGDGTVNEIVNGLEGTDVPLGILPLGTVNVLARDLRIPLPLSKAVRVITEGNVRRIDLGHANGRCFTLMAGFGFDAEVVANVLQPMKDMIGSSAYVLKALETLAKYEATDVVLEMPEETCSTSAFLIIIANVSTYTYNLKVAPYASPDDGLLDVCVFQKPVSDKIGFVRQVADVLIHRHLYHRSVKYFRTSRVAIKSEPEIMVQLDGDAYGPTPIEVSVSPRALPVMAPALPRRVRQSSMEMSSSPKTRTRG